MAPTRLKTSLAVCALAIVSAAGLTACGNDDPGVKDPAREGLAIDIGGVDYDVFITRELNLAINPDKALYNGPPAPPGRSLYGVFIQACNHGGKPRTSASEFRVEDNQGNEFQPIQLPEQNPFAYHPRALAKDDCIPEVGSVAQQGNTAGAMLLFQFPLANTENRPLELVITGAYDAASGKRPSKRFRLDL